MPHLFCLYLIRSDKQMKTNEMIGDFVSKTFEMNCQHQYKVHKKQCPLQYNVRSMAIYQIGLDLNDKFQSRACPKN